MRKNLFATTPGIIIVGAVIGLIAVWLQKLGNPANMGICVACFERDVAGGLGLHRAAIVPYLRPEIMGLVLGSLAAGRNTRPELVPVRDVQRELLAQGCYLLPYLDLPRDDVHFAALQRIGATGLLRGVGTNVGWSNQTWFHADKNVAGSELAEGLRSLYPAIDFGALSDTVTVAEAGDLLRRIIPDAKVDAPTWDALSLTDFDPDREITRGELAVLFDHAADPFDNVEIDIYGQPKNQ